jgi:hypothetical protein
VARATTRRLEGGRTCRGLLCSDVAGTWSVGVWLNGVAPKADGGGSERLGRPSTNRVVLK